MSPSATGRRVSRAAATGGGRTYRGQVPVNWYAALVIIVILGLVSIVFSRYEFEHPHSTTVQPAVGHTLFAGYQIEVCGKVFAPLAASTDASVAGVSTPGFGVLNVSPHTASEAGNNATLGAFFSGYPGAKLTSSVLEVPGHGTYTDGQSCPKGTPDAGKKAHLVGEVWPNIVATAGTPITGNLADYKIAGRTLIAIGLAPQGTTLKRPGQSIADQVLGFSSEVVNGTTTTTTTTPPVSTTSTPSSTTTTSTPTSTSTTG